MEIPQPPERRPLRLYLLVILAFLAGSWADRSGWLPGSMPRPTGLERTFGEAWRDVQRHYVDRKAIQPDKMTQGAIEGMLASLGDVGHTTYLTAEELQRLQESLNGHLQGIGARLSIRQDRPTIVNTVPGSPAAKAGLRAGDILLQINDKDATGLTLARIVELVRGPPGTQVHLRVQREGKSKPLDFDITRAEIQVPDVTWHMLPKVPIAHIALHEFGKEADEQIRKALEDARSQGAKGILLDLRANPGGLKDQAVAVTSEFLPEGTVFIEQNAQGKRKAVPVQPGGIATEIPMVVLIDRGTASSAEILAGALQDYGRAKLVGTRTFGTGTVLKAYELSDKSAVLLAVSEWFTPKGRQIWHKGIAPDFEVALPPTASILMPEDESKLTSEGLEKSTDKQLLKAMEVLEKQLGIESS